MTSRASPGSALNLVQAANALRSGALESVGLVRDCLAIIATREPAVGAWASLAPEDALARAAAINAVNVIEAFNKDDANASIGAGDAVTAPGPGPGSLSRADCDRSPLRGIPIAVKDIIDVQGMVTGCNSPIYATHRASRDATIVARARAAGAIVLGKTTTQEFATRGNMPATRNPYSTDHTPGGSSSGSAAAVAAGMVPLALSTQTAGSIVRPASYCGIVGFKPSFGWMPLDGVKTIAPSLDTLGLHTRTVTDAWLAYAALKGEEPIPGVDALVGTPLTVGIVRDPYRALAEPATMRAMELAATWLRAAGLRVIDLALPAGFERLGFALDTISDAEACASLATEWQSHRAQLSNGVQSKIARGLELPQAAVAEAYELARQGRARCDQLFGSCDFVLTPSAPGYAPLLSAGDPGDSSFSKLWTILGSPSISVPIRLPGPLPIGLQVVCDIGNDHTALQCARAIEAIFSARAAVQ